MSESVLDESILTSIKKNLGIDEEYEQFDQDIIMHINSVFTILYQLGVGPSGFYIQDKETKWSDYLGSATNLELVKSYITLKVRMLFDQSSLTGAVIDSINRQISEFEWRLNIAVDPDMEEYI